MASTTRPSEDLLEGDAMLGAVAFCAEQLLLAGDWRETIDEVLVHLGNAAVVSRAYLIRVNQVDGDHLATQIAEWCAPGISSQFENPLLQGASLERAGFARWVELLKDRETVHGVVRRFPELERWELERQDIVSIVGLPVVVDGRWWGFVGFDDCVRERAWTRHELDSLRAVAGMLGAAEQARRSEDRRLEVEHRYRAMVELIPAVTYTDLVGEDGETFMGFVSPQIQDILGYPPERFLEDASFWFSIMHPDDLAYLRSIDAFNNADFRPFDHEYRMRHAEGRWVWVHDISTAVLGATGELEYFLGFLTDVSARRDAEERLREAELTFRTMVEQNPAVFYVQEVDPADPSRSITTYVGPGDEELTGYARQATVVDPLLWRRLVHPDDRERVFAADAASNLDGTRRFSEEYRLVRRDGRVVWVLDEARLVEPEGRAPYWQGFQLDITARKEAEQRLQDAHEHLRLMVESSLDAIVTMDGDGTIIGWNPQAEMTFGWTSDEAIGRQLVETIVPHDQRASHAAGLTRWRETGLGPILNERIELQALHRLGTATVT